MLKEFLAWTERHPIALALVLIGGLGGGVSTVTGTTTFLWKLAFPETEDEQKLDPFGRPIVTGRLCPVLYDASCVVDNKSALAEIGKHSGGVIALELRIDWAVDTLDSRWAMCDDGEGVSDVPINLDHSEPSFIVFDVPIVANSCDQQEFLGLSGDVLNAGLTQENAGNQEYLIIGTFFVGSGELFNDTLPTVAYPAWTKLEVFPKS